MFGRRAVLQWAALLTLAPGKAFAAAQRYLLQMNGYGPNAETPLELLTDYLTPNDLFFVRSHWIPQMPDLAKWRLQVDGEVDHPLTLSLAELKKMPAMDVTCVLQCAGNGRALHEPPIPGVQWRYGAVGNARWRGVRVRELLERAGVRQVAMHLHLFGSDDPPGKVPPFHRSMEIGKALDDCILAWEMNGHSLPAPHGGPLRLVVPGWAGDHWMKWLVRLSPQREEQKGFYMETAYRWPNNPGLPGEVFKPEEMRPLTDLSVKSNITTAPARAKIGSTVTIRGFAFSGAPDITRVEISDDDGASWSPAEFDPRHDPYAWRLWTFRWKPRRRGKARLFVRATDSRGTVQPREAVWNQSGYLYNAWHSVDIEVSK